MSRKPINRPVLSSRWLACLKGGEFVSDVCRLRNKREVLVGRQNLTLGFHGTAESKLQQFKSAFLKSCDWKQAQLANKCDKSCSHAEAEHSAKLGPFVYCLFISQLLGSDGQTGAGTAGNQEVADAWDRSQERVGAAVEPWVQTSIPLARNWSKMYSWF